MTLRTLTCAHCGRALVTTNGRKRYCSEPCASSHKCRRRASADEFDPEPLPVGGSLPVAGDIIPNPSHPVRSRVRPAEWRQVGAPRESRYCVCGVLLPLKTPERCSECGRPTMANKAAA